MTLPGWMAFCSAAGQGLGLKVLRAAHVTAGCGCNSARGCWSQQSHSRQPPCSDWVLLVRPCAPHPCDIMAGCQPTSLVVAPHPPLTASLLAAGKAPTLCT